MSSKRHSSFLLSFIVVFLDLCQSHRWAKLELAWGVFSVNDPWQRQNQNLFDRTISDWHSTIYFNKSWIVIKITSMLLSSWHPNIDGPCVSATRTQSWVLEGVPIGLSSCNWADGWGRVSRWMSIKHQSQSTLEGRGESKWWPMESLYEASRHSGRRWCALQSQTCVEWCREGGYFNRIIGLIFKTAFGGYSRLSRSNVQEATFYHLHLRGSHLLSAWSFNWSLVGSITVPI